MKNKTMLLAAVYLAAGFASADDGTGLLKTTYDVSVEVATSFKIQKKLNKELFAEAVAGQTDKVRRLLDLGAQIDSVNQYGATVLMVTVTWGYGRGHLECVNLLGLRVREWVKKA